jgi:hypothetical protein
MSVQHHEPPLGPPDLQLAGFQLWVHGRECPGSDEYWDANWLRVTAHCGGTGASVWVTGPVLTTWELADWIASVEQLYRSLSGRARLQCMEPNLALCLEPEGRAGQLGLTVNITPDQVWQDHRFQFGLDQSYLPALLAAGRNLMRRYPVRGNPHA